MVKVVHSPISKLCDLVCLPHWTTDSNVDDSIFKFLFYIILLS